MTRRRAPLAAAACLALLVAGCGSETGKHADPAPSLSASPEPSATADPVDLSSAGLAALLPATKQMEYLLGIPLELEAREELTDFHEGAAVQADAGQVGFYRRAGTTGPGPDSGGYVALSTFASDADAARFLETNPNYDAARQADPAKGYLEVFDLGEISDAGSGYVLQEAGDPPSDQTHGFARIGRVVIEVALFQQAGAKRISETRQIVDDLRARLPQSTPTATPEPE
jgi:hypothetical protein